MSAAAPVNLRFGLFPTTICGQLTNGTVRRLFTGTASRILEQFLGGLLFKGGHFGIYFEHGAYEQFSPGETNCGAPVARYRNRFASMAEITAGPQ